MLTLYRQAPDRSDRWSRRDSWWKTRLTWLTSERLASGSPNRPTRDKAHTVWHDR